MEEKSLNFLEAFSLEDYHDGIERFEQHADTQRAIWKKQLESDKTREKILEMIHATSKLTVDIDPHWSKWFEAHIVHFEEVRSNSFFFANLSGGSKTQASMEFLIKKDGTTILTELVFDYKIGQKTPNTKAEWFLKSNRITQQQGLLFGCFLQELHPDTEQLIVSILQDAFERINDQVQEYRSEMNRLQANYFEWVKDANEYLVTRLLDYKRIWVSSIPTMSFPGNCLAQELNLVQHENDELTVKCNEIIQLKDDVYRYNSIKKYITTHNVVVETVLQETIITSTKDQLWYKLFGHRPLL